MFGIFGIVFLNICVFGSFLVGGGQLGTFAHAAPIEGWCILGSAIGGMLIGNSPDVVKAVFAGIGRTFKGSKYHKDDYLNAIFCVSKVMKTLKTEGAVALEAHIENPEASSIFGEYPKIVADHALLHLICDTVRLMVVSQGTISTTAIEDIMDAAIKTHHNDELKASGAIATLAGALPALGIVSCVMGGQDHGQHRPAAGGARRPGGRGPGGNVHRRVFGLRIFRALRKAPGADY